MFSTVMVFEQPTAVSFRVLIFQPQYSTFVRFCQMATGTQEASPPGELARVSETEEGRSGRERWVKRNIPTAHSRNAPLPPPPTAAVPLTNYGIAATGSYTPLDSLRDAPPRGGRFGRSLRAAPKGGSRGFCLPASTEASTPLGVSASTSVPFGIRWYQMIPNGTTGIHWLPPDAAGIRR